MLAVIRVNRPERSEQFRGGVGLVEFNQTSERFFAVLWRHSGARQDCGVDGSVLGIVSLPLDEQQPFVVQSIQLIPDDARALVQEDFRPLELLRVDVSVAVVVMIDLGIGAIGSDGRQCHQHYQSHLHA